MTEVLHLPRTGTASYRATTLDELWAEAETLGKVSVGPSYPHKYRATVQFDCRHGTVFAEGKHESVAVALGTAINNARELGAGATET